MAPAQMPTIFNTYTRAEYIYGLVLVGLCREIEAENERWEDASMKALVKRRANIKGKIKEN